MRFSMISTAGLMLALAAQGFGADAQLGGASNAFFDNEPSGCAVAINLSDFSCSMFEGSTNADSGAAGAAEALPNSSLSGSDLYDGALTLTGTFDGAPAIDTAEAAPYDALTSNTPAPGGDVVSLAISSPVLIANVPSNMAFSVSVNSLVMNMSAVAPAPTMVTTLDSATAPEVSTFITLLAGVVFLALYARYCLPHPNSEGKLEKASLARDIRSVAAWCRPVRLNRELIP